MKSIALAAGLALLTASAVSAQVAQPVAAPGKTTTLVHDGSTFEVSRGATTAVFMTPVAKISQNGRLGFLLLVKNGGPQPIKLTEASITAQTQAGAPVALMTRARLLDEAKRHQAAAEANHRNGDVPIMGATPMTGGVGALGTSGVSARLAGGSTSSSEKQAQWSGERDPGFAGLSGDSAKLPDYVKTAEEEALQPADIAPGQTASTVFTLDRIGRDVTALEVKVAVGPDTHVLRFAISDK